MFDPFTNFEFLQDKTHLKLIKSLSDFKHLVKLINITDYIEPFPAVPSKTTPSGAKKQGSELQVELQKWVD